MYYPQWRYPALGAACVAVALGLPMGRSPWTVYWTAVVFVSSYFFWRRFLRCETSANGISGRDPENLRSAHLEWSEVQDVKPAKFGILGIPGIVAYGKNEKRVFLHESTVNESKVKALLDSGAPSREKT